MSRKQLVWNLAVCFLLTISLLAGVLASDWMFSALKGEQNPPSSQLAVRSR